MKKRILATLLVLCLLPLAGCLFTVNHPLFAPDGTMAVFLMEGNGYTLFPEEAVLHLLRDNEWMAIPAATVAEAGGLLDISPDGTQLLYVEIESGEWFEPVQSTLYRVDMTADAIPEVLLQSEEIIARAEWMTNDAILVLRFGEEELGALEALDPETGQLESVFDDVLSFSVDPSTQTVFLLGVEQERDLAIGHFGRWDPVLDDGDELGSFIVSEGTAESFMTLPHDFFWDVSPDGRWLALALYDTAMLSPSAETDLPAIYLIDTEFGEADRIAVEGLIPTFSPDGSLLTYLGTDDGLSSHVVACDLTTAETYTISGTENAQTFFWIDAGRLGVTFEGEDDLARLVVIDPELGTAVELLGIPAGEPIETPDEG